MERVLKSKYRIGEKINEDERSVTYKGTVLGGDDPVTIKIFKRDALSNTLIKTLLRDLQPLTALAHPSIPRLLDGDYGWQGFYYVREYVDGESLWDFMKYKRVLSEDQWLSIMTTVAEAVKTAHDQGILHGTLSPGDIFFTKEGRVKVTDFRLGLSMRNSILGRTLAVAKDAVFLAPEEILGEPSSRASDIYRLGTVFYLLLTGRLPFEDEGLAAALKNLKEQPARPSRLNPAVPKYLDDITLCALAKEPLLRFSDASKLIECLRAKTLLAEELMESDFPEADVLESPPDIITQAANPEAPLPLVPKPPREDIRKQISKIPTQRLIVYGFGAAVVAGALFVALQPFFSQ